MLTLGLAACFGAGESETATLRLATTTSVDNTGLLAHLLAPFEGRTGLKVNVISVGSGQALALARRGDVDAVVVHAPDAEAEFMAAGYGIDHRRLMHNDFVIVGPKEDPAGVRGQSSAVAALTRIAEAQATFISRGDDSGTHQAELKLWQAAKQKPGGPWYLESGQGQRMNLGVAGEKQAYCFVDRGTYLVARDQVRLEILMEGDPLLHNPYSIIAVHPEKHPGIHHTAALALVAWLTSEEAQRRIGEFHHQGTPLFRPAALPPRTPR
jgi:tungstate transport system substrate-binding protein